MATFAKAMLKKVPECVQQHHPDTVSQQDHQGADPEDRVEVDLGPEMPPAPDQPRAADDLAEDAAAKADDEAAEEEYEAMKAERERWCDRLHQVQRERRDLHKRNLQAQTNIAQYLRNHNMELMAPNSDINPTTALEEYEALLNHIQDLADAEAEEQGEFHKFMSQIESKKSILNKEICRLRGEVNKAKTRVVNEEPLACARNKDIGLKEMMEHTKNTELLDQATRLVRLRFVKLNRLLDHTSASFRNLADQNQMVDLDQAEVTVENQIVCDALDDREEMLAKLNSRIQSHVIVLTHIGVKLREKEQANHNLQRHLDLQTQSIAQLKDEERRLKMGVTETMKACYKLQQEVGLLNQEALLKDYSSTLKHMLHFRSQLASPQHGFSL